MVGSTGHLSPSGRRRELSSKALPPIPERGLSSQNASGSVVRNGGAVSRDGVGHKNARGVIMSESRTSARLAIAEVESRDDANDLAAASAVASADACHITARPIREIVFQVESELGLPPPPPAAISDPKEFETSSTSSTLISATSKNSTRFFIPHSPRAAMSTPVKIESASITSRNTPRLTTRENTPCVFIRPAPSDAMTAPEYSDSVSITSRNSRRSARSRNSNRLLASPAPPAAMSAPFSIESTSITSSNKQTLPPSDPPAISDGAVESVTAVSDIRIVDEQAPLFVHAASFKMQPSQTDTEPRKSSSVDSIDATTTYNLTGAITPFGNNRKHTSELVCSSYDDTRCTDTERIKVRVAKYTAEMSDGYLQHIRCEDDKLLNLALLCEPGSDPPEITSIPTDEILDSFTKEQTNDHNLSLSDEMTDSVSRETRDQYQLGRLQARINQRRQIHSHISQEEYAPNYKTMRSSRIKTARTFFNAKQSHNSEESSSHSGANSIRGLIANNSSSIPENTSSTSPYLANKTSSSTICSLNRGCTIGPSNTSSSSGIHSASNSGSRSTLCDQELNAQRSELFQKMIHMLNDISSNRNLDDVSTIKEMLMNESRASCSSNAELKLIQKHTEDEMSRILNEFEQNNSLIEKKDSVSYKFIPEFGIPELGSPESAILEFTYQNNATSISTKFSEITSPTCHDGSEADEIIIPSPPRHKTKKSRSPSIAVSLPSGSMSIKLKHCLASANNSPDKNELEVGNGDDAKNGKMEHFSVKVEEAKIEGKRDQLSHDGMKNGRIERPFVEVGAGEIEAGNEVSSLDVEVASVASFRALDRRKVKVRGSTKNQHFHDDILRAVSMATASPIDDAYELLTVTSILSHYEEAGMKAKLDLINEEFIKAKIENHVEDFVEGENRAEGESDIPFDDKPNHQTCGCATWLCLE